TGGNADNRFLYKPSQTAAVVKALYAAVTGGTVTGIEDTKLKEGIEKAAKALLAAKGAALVVAGSNDTNVQIVVNGINEALQAGGNTIDWSAPLQIRQGVDSDFAKLVDEMNAGAVRTIFFYGANPAYTWYDAEKFKAGLAKTSMSVSFNWKEDETTQLCKVAIPDHHFLESWGDAEVKAGYISLLQPTIYPLFKTRQFQDTLLKWSGSAVDYVTYLKNYWSTKLGGITAWDEALQTGVIVPASATLAGASFNSAAVATALGALSASKAGKYELVLYQKVGLAAGHGANNPWLQELPDPVTKATWDNYIIVSPTLAKSLLKIDLTNGGQADAYETQPAKKVVKLTSNGKSISLPVLIIPGTEANTVGIAVGYGRTEKYGRASAGVGKNAYVLSQLINGNIAFESTDVQLELQAETYKVGLTQTHNTYDTEQGNRTEVMKEMTFAAYKHNPAEIREERDKELKPWGGLEKFESQGTIYPVYDRPGVKWGMSIDLNACNGCGACVVACNAENNVAVVGKSEVVRGHEMHWLRIDRYYSGSLENPKVVFQPLMCQHCDNAPCENVCPVAATNHSSEGINQMTYNRCIGTRYCANNCPYKVRRFNWADYNGSDSFADNQKSILDDSVMMMNDDLTRMVLNPDVTVRARGVIEKCSFCFQRLQEGKLKAKKESRPLETGKDGKWDLQVACQQACAADAIVFGNANDKHSAITMHRTTNGNRLFSSLEMLHVLPNVTYLAKVRNTFDEGTHHTAEKPKAPAAAH
ncbi:MAG: 4Fe-4S dicluster domain-containing protein, partial [Bacteroidetes bacterium]